MLWDWISGGKYGNPRDTFEGMMEVRRERGKCFKWTSQAILRGLESTPSDAQQMCSYAAMMVRGWVPMMQCLGDQWYSCGVMDCIWDGMHDLQILLPVFVYSKTFISPFPHLIDQELISFYPSESSLVGDAQGWRTMWKLRPPDGSSGLLKGLLQGRRREEE